MSFLPAGYDISNFDHASYAKVVIHGVNLWIPNGCRIT